VLTDGCQALAASWVRYLPAEFCQKLAAALRSGPDAVLALKATVSLAELSEAAQQALQVAGDGDGAYLSGALTARLGARSEQPQLLPVWTGPGSAQQVGRLTVAAISDLIDEAQEDLLLVSYATFPEADVLRSLADAVNRGVAVTALLEREEDNPHYNGNHDALPGLDIRRLHWPGHLRPPGASMHAKVLVVDRRIALVGSANLTGAGLDKNLECGLLVRGGPVPGEIAAHILSMHGLAPGRKL
jgi:phosphatidylserine/phosphatidylglycerophosphate/cardiolipin synthase-like enzyme